jgi:uncharacterized membrane-anchored protein YhcB (DUF1043 family)
MIVAAITWPTAIVHVAWIAAVGLVLSVLIWSIFRTGQTAIKKEAGQHELLESLRTEVDELRRELRRLDGPDRPTRA